MNILYLADARIPTEKAHGVAIAKMVEALAKAGHQVSLILSKRQAGKESIIKEDLFSYYLVNRVFKVKRLFCFDFQCLHQLGLGKLAFLIRTPIFLIELMVLTILNTDKVIYTRDGLIAGAASLFNKKVFFEPHRPPSVKSRGYYQKVFGRLKGIITLTKREKETLVREYGLSPEKVKVEPSAIDLNDFVLPDKSSVRKKLGIPQDRTVLSYIGKLNIIGQAKKLDELVGAFKKALAVNSKLFLLIGGLKPEDLNYHNDLIKKEGLGNDAALLPHVPFNQVREYYAASDIFLLPYDKHVLENLSLSPLKLFEYASSRRPIISSRSGSIEEIFNESEIVYFQAGNYDDLVKKIMELSDDASRREQIAEKAFAKVKNYTWQRRAANLTAFIQSRL